MHDIIWHMNRMSDQIREMIEKIANCSNVTWTSLNSITFPSKTIQGINIILKTTHSTGHSILPKVHYSCKYHEFNVLWWRFHWFKIHLVICITKQFHTELIFPGCLLNTINIQMNSKKRNNFHSFSLMLNCSLS